MFLSALPIYPVAGIREIEGKLIPSARPPLMERAGLVPEASFHDKGNRALSFKTNRDDIRLIRVRAFDVATFVAFVLGYVSIAWLLKFVSHHSMVWFAGYRVILGSVVIGLLAAGVITS